MQKTSLIRIDPQRAALVRELRPTGYPEKSIYRWLAAGTGPRDPNGRRAWDRAIAAARKKLGIGGKSTKSHG